MSHLPLSCPEGTSESTTKTAPAAPALWTAQLSRAELGGPDLPGEASRQPGGGDSERSKEGKSSPPNLGEYQFPFSEFVIKKLTFMNSIEVP